MFRTGVYEIDAQAELLRAADPRVDALATARSYISYHWLADSAPVMELDHPRTVKVRGYRLEATSKTQARRHGPQLLKVLLQRSGLAVEYVHVLGSPTYLGTRAELLVKAGAAAARP